MSDPRPTCAICQRPVDEIATWRDGIRRVTVYRARCHGDEQVVDLDDSLLVTSESISPGLAFATPQLTEKSSRG